METEFTSPLTKVLLEHRETERSSPTIVHFTKETSCGHIGKSEFEVVVNRLPEDILIQWLSDFLEAIQSDTGLDYVYFDGKTQLGRKPLPLRYDVYSQTIEVYYIVTDRNETSRPSLYLIIDGTKASIERCKLVLIDKKKEAGKLHKVRENSYITLE